MPKLTEEQLETRRSFIGASDIGAIAGLNPFKDAFDVLNEKQGFVYADKGDNEAAEWGHRLEPVIREWYCTLQWAAEDHNEAWLDKTKLAPCGTVRHPTLNWAGCTLDSKIAGTRRGLEIKVVGHRMVFDWDPGDDQGVPHYVRAQAAWQMWVCDLEEIDVAALLGGSQARVWRIPRDVDLEATLVTMGERFWRENVQGGIAPPLTGSNSVRQYLDHKYPPLPAPVIVDAGPEEHELAMALAAARGTRDVSEKHVREIQARFIATLGEKGGTDLVGSDWEFRFRTRKDGTRQPWFRRKGDK